MAVGTTAPLFPVVLLLCGGAALAEFEIISGPGENSPLVCDEHWIAWRNNTAPFYDLLSRSFPCIYPINGTLVNTTCNGSYIQVLEGSMPIIPVWYFEEGENGTMGRPVICFTPPSGPLAPPPDSTPLLVVIYITSSLAIIASLIALATYSLLPRLRTLPGLIIMNLFLSFLLGEIMLQVRIGFEYRGNYQTINNILSQGLLVSRFIWMSLAGLEMCRSLYRGIRMRIDSWTYQKWVTLAVYMAVGWGVSVILTIVMGVVEVEGGKELREQLGVFGYVSNVVPIALSQLFNIGAVVFISIVIVRAARQQRKVRTHRISKQNINFIRLFIILLTVLGLVWLTLFIILTLPKEYAQELGVNIAFVVITDTQPVFVCIAFVCTPKVCKMWLVKLHLREADSLENSNRRVSSSSVREIGRAKTQTSFISLNSNALPLEKASPGLEPIAEEEENRQANDSDEETAVENGDGVAKTGNGTPNGVLQTPNSLSQSNGGDAVPTTGNRVIMSREDSPSPSDSSQSNPQS